MGIGELEYWAKKHCPYAASSLTPYLILPHYATIFITLALYTIGLVRRELYLFLLGIGLTSNGWLNSLLKWAFSQPVPYALCGFSWRYCVNAAFPAHNACGVGPWPPYDPASGATCGAPPLDPCEPCVTCGMPSFEAQDTAFLVTSIILYVYTWRHPNIRPFHATLLVAWMALMAWSNAFFGFNSPAQIIVGASVGAAYAFLWHVSVYVWAYPLFDRVLQWPITRWFDYDDTFCQTYEEAPGDPPLVQ